MPGRDGTGPSGTGAMTGIGLGFCTGVNAGRYHSGFAAGYGRGLGLGSGFGCRRGRFLNSALSEPDEKDMLSAEKNMLEVRLKAINKQLDRMRKSEE